ncbi:MAG: hypothetical protein QM765_30875 [Myxococcales bacterium]
MRTRSLATVTAVAAFAVLLPLAAAFAAGAKTPEERLLGTWREEQEFGGDPNRPVEKRPFVEFKKGTYVHTYPATGGKPMEGKWSVASAKGDELVLKMTLQLDPKTAFPVDDQKIVFKDADTFEMRNAKNGHGGVYKRLK